MNLANMAGQARAHLILRDQTGVGNSTGDKN
jgi:hypothetical protein